MITRKSFIPFFYLHFILLIYSVAGIFSKLASGYDFLSYGFIFFYVLVLVVLFVFAIIWQQILKKIPLNTAYANKSIIIIWGILWGRLFFNEMITINKVIGALVIIIGLFLVITDE